MSDDQNANTTEAAEQPQEGAEQPAETKTFDADYVKKLRDEAAKYRTEAKANAKAAEKLAEISDDKTIPATDKVKMLGELKELAKDLV